MPGRPAASRSRRARRPGRRRRAGSCGGGRRSSRPIRTSRLGRRSRRPITWTVPRPVDAGSARARVRRRAAVELGEVGVDVARRALASSIIVGQAGGLCLEDRDLVVDPGARVQDERAPLVRVAGRLEALAIALAGVLVLEQLADLGEREAGVVAQAPDEPQALEVRGVVQAIVAVGARGRLEQTDLLVVADRAGRQAGLGGDLLDPQQRRIPGVSVAAGRSAGVVISPRPTTTLTLRKGYVGPSGRAEPRSVEREVVRALVAAACAPSRSASARR